MSFNNVGIINIIDKKDNWFHLNLGSWIKILQHVLMWSLIMLRLNNKDALAPTAYTLLPKTNVV